MIPTPGLFRQIGADFLRVRQEEGNSAFQYLAGLEDREVREDLLDCLAPANCVGDAVERYSRARNTVATAVNFDILTGWQIAHTCL